MRQADFQQKEKIEIWRFEGNVCCMFRVSNLRFLLPALKFLCLREGFKKREFSLGGDRFPDSLIFGSNRSSINDDVCLSGPSLSRTMYYSSSLIFSFTEHINREFLEYSWIIFKDLLRFLALTSNSSSRENSLIF